VNGRLSFLHLTTFYPPYAFGGDGVQVYRLAHALADQGHHVDVVHCTDAYRLLHPGDPPVAFPEHPGVTRHELRSGYGWLSPVLAQQTGGPLLKRRTILDLLRARDYDVVHFHNISLLGPGVLALRPQRGNPIRLYTAHEHWLVCPMHVLWKFGRKPCDAPECLRCVLKSKRPPQLWRYTGMLGRMARHVDQFIAPSHFTAQMHAERGFQRDFVRLPNFIDSCDDDWKNPAPRPWPNPYFLFAGRLEIVKGPQTLIDAWRHAPEIDLLIAGAGSEEPALRRAAAENPRIRFLGPLGQRELGAYHHHALACIVPSVTYETFGLASIEAFARKTPVIARDLGALPEVVEESGGGFVYNTQDELLEAVRTIASSPRLRDDLGRKGYDSFRKFWSREAHLKLYFDLLGTIAERRSGASATFAGRGSEKPAT